MSVFDLTQLASERQRSGRLYLEFLRQATLSVGLYELTTGATDPQRPHSEDEIYYVVRGRASVRIGSEDTHIQPGAVIFVPARQEHHFHSITEDLMLLVVFAPTEGSSDPSAGRAKDPTAKTLS